MGDLPRAGVVLCCLLGRWLGYALPVDWVALTHNRTFTPLPSLPEFGRWFIFAKKPILKPGYPLANVLTGRKSGLAAFGRARLLSPTEKQNEPAHKAAQN